MSIDRNPPLLTPEEQRLQDEKKVFDLARSMMEVYTSVLLKSPDGLIKSMNYVGELLRQDPTFVGRFKAASDAFEKAKQEARIQSAQ